MNNENAKLKMIISKRQINKMIKELAGKIRESYNAGEKVVCICVLRGAVFFFADLMRELNGLNTELEFITISSYRNSLQSYGEVKLIHDIRCEIENKNVLIVEDIIDSGLSLQYLINYLKDKKPLSLKSVCLLNKSALRKVDIKPDYCGFELSGSAFVAGYGLDYKQKYRNLPEIYEVIQEK